MTRGQVELEWVWLRSKLSARSPEWLDQWSTVTVPDLHRSFHAVDGPIAPWERLDLADITPMA